MFYTLVLLTSLVKTQLMVTEKGTSLGDKGSAMDSLMTLYYHCDIARPRKKQFYNPNCCDICKIFRAIVLL